MTGTFDAHRTRMMAQALALPGDLHAYAEVSRGGTRVDWLVTDAAGEPVAHGSDRIARPWTNERRAEALEARMRALEWEYVTRGKSAS